MSAKEELIAELGFLDDSAVVLDEKPKSSKDKAKQKRNEEVPDSVIEQSLLNAIDGMSDEAALAVLAAYRKIPKTVKDAVKAVYAAMETLGGDSTMEDVKSSLIALKESCGEDYGGLYESAVKDAKKYVPKIQSRLLTEGIGE